MTLLMRDSIDARLIPRDTPVVAGYGDGEFIWSPSWVDGSNWWDLFPAAVHLVIVVNAAHAGDILDVERGDATPADCPGWADRFDRPARRRPTIYCNRDTIDQVRAAMAGRAFDWWCATLDGTQAVDGAVAVQYVDVGPYDESVIADPSWVGGDIMAEADILDAIAEASHAIHNTYDLVAGDITNRLERIEAAIPTTGTALTATQAQQLADLAAAVARIEKAAQSA